MIPGHDDLWSRERIEERAGLFELEGSRPLRQVAGDRDNIGSNVVDGVNERSNDRLVNATEMNIG